MKSDKEFESQFNILNPGIGLGYPKATVHRTGRLGFSRDADKLIGFKEAKFFRIATKKDTKDDALYLIPSKEKDNMYVLKVAKAGNYHNLKTEHILGKLGIDYKGKDKGLIFDIEEVREDDRKYFRMTRRKKSSKQAQ